MRSTKDTQKPNPHSLTYIFSRILLKGATSYLIPFLEDNPTFNFLSYADCNGNNALAILVIYRRTQTLKFFLEYITAKDTDEMTLQLFLDHPNNKGFTPLMLAARQGKPKAITLLLNAGANPYEQNSKDGRNAIYYCATFHRKQLSLFKNDVGRLELGKGQEDTCTLLNRTLDAEDWEAFDYLLLNSEEFQKDALIPWDIINKCFDYICQHKLLKSIPFLLSYGADPSHLTTSRKYDHLNLSNLLFIPFIIDGESIVEGIPLKILLSKINANFQYISYDPLQLIESAREYAEVKPNALHLSLRSIKYKFLTLLHHAQLTSLKDPTKQVLFSKFFHHKHFENLVFLFQDSDKASPSFIVKHPYAQSSKEAIPICGQFTELIRSHLGSDICDRLIILANLYNQILALMGKSLYPSLLDEDLKTPDKLQLLECIEILIMDSYYASASASIGRDYTHALCHHLLNRDFSQYLETVNLGNIDPTYIFLHKGRSYGNIFDIIDLAFPSTDVVDFVGINKKLYTLTNTKLLMQYIASSNFEDFCHCLKLYKLVDLGQTNHLGENILTCISQLRPPSYKESFLRKLHSQYIINLLEDGDFDTCISFMKTHPFDIYYKDNADRSIIRVAMSKGTVGLTIACEKIINSIRVIELMRSDSLSECFNFMKNHNFYPNFVYYDGRELPEFINEVCRNSSYHKKFMCIVNSVRIVELLQKNILRAVFFFMKHNDFDINYTTPDGESLLDIAQQYGDRIFVERFSLLLKEIKSIKENASDIYNHRFL